MFERKELLNSKEYWLARIQTKLFSLLDEFMKENNLNRTQLAEKLGFTKGYISQVLNGNSDHRMSKIIELSLAINKVPQIHFEDVDQVIEDDEMGLLYEEVKDRPIVNLEINFDSQDQEIDLKASQGKKIRQSKEFFEKDFYSNLISFNTEEYLQ